MSRQIHRQRYPKTIVSIATLQSPSDNLLYHLHLGTKTAEQHSLYCPNAAQQIAKVSTDSFCKTVDCTNHIAKPCNHHSGHCSKHHGICDGENRCNPWKEHFPKHCQYHRITKLPTSDRTQRTCQGLRTFLGEQHHLCQKCRTQLWKYHNCSGCQQQHNPSGQLYPYFCFVTQHPELRTSGNRIHRS